MNDSQRQLLITTRAEMMSEAKRPDTPEFQAEQLYRLAKNIHEVLRSTRRVKAPRN